MHALYDFAGHPEYIEPIREEVQKIVAEEGWTKSSMAKMHKLDSFLKETCRMHPLVSGFDSVLQLMAVGSRRVVLKPFTFSNGVTVSKGTLVGAPVSAIHMDETLYDRPNEFDGLRFFNLRQKHGDLPQYHCANTNTNCLTFGTGRHAW